MLATYIFQPEDKKIVCLGSLLEYWFRDIRKEIAKNKWLSFRYKNTHVMMRNEAEKEYLFFHAIQKKRVRKIKNFADYVH